MLTALSFYEIFKDKELIELNVDFNINAKVVDIDFKPGNEITVTSIKIKDNDGEIRYYVDGVATYAGLVLFEGNYYYFGSDLKAAKNITRAVSKHNNLLPFGTYTFDANGMLIPKA